jgi:hypothetical protein
MNQTELDTRSAESGEELHLLKEGTSFRPHRYLYRVLQPNQDFLNADGFSSYADAVSRVLASGKKIVLSIGESSTSGWDTTITPINRQRKALGLTPISAFFRYKNYTDLLRDRIGSEFEVLNAGIPGHTVLSGIRRLKLLRDAFLRDGVRVDFVVAHFGNNDCLWESNLRDRFHLAPHPRIPIMLEQQRLRFFPRKRDRIVLRTSVEDFGRYNSQLVHLVRQMGAVPILIKPEIPLYWQPGRRYVDFDFEWLAKQPGGALVMAKLDEAKRLWSKAIAKPYSASKLRMLQDAAELDFVIPRLKQVYAAELCRVAALTHTTLVQTPVTRDADEQLYFVDYCHPREIINTQIAAQIEAAIHGPVSGN